MAGPERQLVGIKKFQDVHQPFSIVETAVIDVHRVGDTQDRGQESGSDRFTAQVIVPLGFIIAPVPAAEQADQRRFPGTEGQFAGGRQPFDRLLADDVVASAVYCVTDVVKKSRRLSHFVAERKLGHPGRGDRHGRTGRPGLQ